MRAGASGRSFLRSIGAIGTVLLAPLALLAPFAPLAPLAQQAFAQPAPPAAQPGRDAMPLRIVVLNVADPTLPAFLEFDARLRETVLRSSRWRPEFYLENLDAVRFPREGYEDALAGFLARKYAGMKVEVVVAVGPSGLAFAERRRDVVWPGARIVYVEAPEETVGRQATSRTTTGVLLRHDMAGTAALALRLRPQTRRLVVVAGSGDYDRMMLGIAKSQLQGATAIPAIEYWSDLPVAELLDRAAKLTGDDAVLYLSVGRDAGGDTFVPREVLQRLASTSRAPVYGSFDSYLGYGVVGGMLHRFSTSGKLVGQQILASMAAAPGAAVAPAVDAAPCVADADELDRFGIATGRLPEACTVVHSRPSIWRDYRGYVVGALSLLLAQSGLLLGLLWQRRARRRAEAEARRRRGELSQASRLALAGEMTASIAHEINQPLGSILANAGAAEALLRRGEVDVAELRAILADIQKSDLRASDIVRRVRALVTSHEAERVVLDIDPLVGDVVAFLRPEARQRGIAFSARLDSRARVEGDRAQLQQAMVNLCVNAMDAMADTQGPREVGVATAVAGGGRVAIEVRDTGPGIAPDQLARVFDAFFTTKREGMGIGLSLSRSIVEAHGGTLSATNAPGGGAVFRIELPAA